MRYSLLLFILLTMYYFSCQTMRKDERFSIGHGTSFSEFISPEACTPENDCFPGYYYRSQIYQNMCEPRDDRILRKKKDVVDNCLRKL